MVTIPSLWLPILLSAVVVWVLSAIVWMFLPHRKKEFKGLPNEEPVRAALKGVGPGHYWVPWGTPEQMKDPELIRKYQEGPAGIIQLWKPGMPSMGKSMVLSLLYYLAVGIVVAYIASRTLDPGADYSAVFRIVGCTAWLAYGFGGVPDSIWFGRPWSFTWKTLAEAFVYGLFTGGVFGWLWP